MASKRKQEEKHLKMLREMVAQEPNKKCFDCGQRGPTYVNMTIGSFVCTTCSGILRGLNPPHRVKSISMASYTPQEMEFLQQKGNEYCRHVWLGLWDARSQAEPESRDEQKVKDFMSQKYERKRWYIAPEQAAILASQKLQQQQNASSVPEAKPLKTFLGKDPAPIQVQNHSQSPPQIKTAAPLPTPPQFQHHQQQQQQPQPVQPPKPSVDLLGELGGDPFGTSAFGVQQQQPPPQQQQATSNFAAFGTAQQQQQQHHQQQQQQQQQPQQQQGHFDPFGSGQQQGGGFADFSSAFDQQAAKPAAGPPTGFSGANTANPFGEAVGPSMVPLSTETVTTSSANQPPIPAVFPPPPSSNNLLQPNQPGQPATSQQNNFGAMVSAAPGAPQGMKPGDRYAALSELDTLFHDTTSNINWSGGPASSAPSNASVFSSGSSFAAQQATSMPQSSSLGNIGTATSWSGGGIMSASPSMGSTPPSNPFMAPPPAGQGVNQQGMATSAGFGQTPNPFLAQPSGTGFVQANGPYGQTGQSQANMGFGAQPASGFGMQQPPQQAGGFGTQQAGGFGTQQAGGFGTQQAGGFGQPAGFGGAMQGFGQQQPQPQQQPQQQQSLSFGGAGMTAMAGQQFAKVQQQPQQQQFGGWGQPMQQPQQQQMNMGSNPFMAAGQNQYAAKSATGNPFL
ncbi:uncharacterized protein LOC144442282 isoform X2 [Glandiceps talaboti]